MRGALRGSRVRARRGCEKNARYAHVFLAPSGWIVGILVCVALFFVAPATALAQGGTTTPLSPGLPQSPATTTAPNSSPAPVLTNPSTTSSSGGGLSGSAAIEIALGAFIVLGGISLFIWRDARRRAPGRAAAATAGAGRSHPGSKARPKPRKPSPAERRRRKRGRAR